jgi:hypothetical protein
MRDAHFQIGVSVFRKKNTKKAKCPISTFWFFVKKNLDSGFKNLVHFLVNV